MQQESLGEIQGLVGITPVGVQIPASAPFMYGFIIYFLCW